MSKKHNLNFYRLPNLRNHLEGLDNRALKSTFGSKKNMLLDKLTCETLSKFCFHHTLLGGQITGNAIGGSCNKHDRNEKCTQNVGFGTQKEGDHFE
jgi:hypothetical protein